MSGIIGVVRTDGAPVEPGLIQRLTESLTLFGPDAKATWRSGAVAFGHTLLRTTYESAREHQPLSLDGQVWIVADARLDARRDLVSQLHDWPRSQSDVELIRAPDVELALRAYLRWGEGCVGHLFGDFAFAIWDGRSQRLFCARDHMGVKPLYYACGGGWLLFSNSVECLRRHPAVSDTLHDLAIADFLLFGVNQDPATTSFHDIRRLPPAHTLTWSERGISVRRYWTLPIEEPVYYRQDREYTDQLVELLREAVSDRLRTERVSVFMSGGLDSPALAATARDLLDRDLLNDDRTTNQVRAFTFVYDSLIPDSERQYAGLASEHLAIPIRYYALDGQSGWAPSDALGTHDEPDERVTDRSAEVLCYSEMAAHSRVAFYGEGPDNALLYEWRPYLTHLMRRRRWGRLAADAVKHVISHKRVPLLPTLPRMFQARRALKSKQSDPPVPAWMAPELVSRLRLEQRWRDLRANSNSPHPVRPRAYASLQSPLWQSMFESFQPSYTGIPLEVRHPFVDIRLLRFLLRVPVLPWCRNKHLMRCALRGVLPEAVRLRSKTPLNGEPDSERVRRHGLPPVTPSRLLDTYGHAGSVSNTRLESVAAMGAALRFVALSYWLQGIQQGTKRGIPQGMSQGSTL